MVEVFHDIPRFRFLFSPPLVILIPIPALDRLSSSSMSADAHSGMEESSLSWQPAQVSVMSLPELLYPDI